MQGATGPVAREVSRKSRKVFESENALHRAATVVECGVLFFSGLR
jgi:hypothetical protein